MSFRRTLSATALAVVALAAPAAASDGTYTAMVCANPDTGIGTAAGDGVFPDGVRMSAADNVNMTTLQNRQQCSGTVHGGRGLTIATNGAYHLLQTHGAAFVYELPSTLAFKGATIYGRTNTLNGMIAKVVRASSDWMYASPGYYACEQPGHNCNGTGTSADPFGAANRITVGAAHDNMERGFKWFLRCAWYGCNVTNDNVFAVYGGKVSIGDGAGPSGSVTGGGLTAGTAMRGPKTVAFNAADGESGVYRARLVVDGQPQPWSVVAGGSATCRDVNFANGDAYEFAVRVPCPKTAGGTADLDTRAFADGEHAIRLVVEDAAGNAATIFDRDIEFDNIDPPSSESEPVVRGTARVGSSLAVTAATWSNGGAAGEPAITRSWERCRRDGTQCTPTGGEDVLYEPTAADVGRRLRVVETATNSEGSATSTSPLTDQVRAADGTLPPGDDGVDNDCDGQTDEPGEPGACPPPGGGTEDTSGAGGTPLTPTKVVTTTTPAPPPVSATARSTAGPLNGDGASPTATLTAKATKPTLDYGRTTSVTGRLVDATGRPIRNAIIDVASTAELRGAKAAAAAPVVTGGDGSFTAPVTGKGGTRTLTFAYRYQREGAVVARADVRLVVRARVQLSVKLQGIVATYSGKVLAGVPKGGKLVIVQGRAKGGSWQTFASRRATKSGTFKGRYRLKIRRPGKRLQFRVRVLAESGWNYRGVTSKPVTKTVR